MAPNREFGPLDHKNGNFCAARHLTLPPGHIGNHLGDVAVPDHGQRGDETILMSGLRLLPRCLRLLVLMRHFVDHGVNVSFRRNGE